MGKLYKELGIDVELKSEVLPNDPSAHESLRRIGKEICPNGFSYMGSAAVHYFKASMKNEVNTIHQMAIGDMNEVLASVGLQNFAIAFKQHFNRAHKTTDQDDKRGANNE